MNLEYKHLLPEDFAPNSRVWIYQSNRLFAKSEVIQIEDILNNFLVKWNSHGTPVKGFVGLFFGQFIILMADENATGVSGCSTDSSIHLMKEIEQLYKVSLFNRQDLSFIIKDHVEILPLNQINDAIDNHIINADSLYFNNLVENKKELESKWIIPVKDSWLNKRIPLTKNIAENSFRLY